MSEVKFGTGGWRAVIGDGFTRENIMKLARAVADKMKEEGVADRPVVLGYDRRFLSKEAMQWCGTVLASEGIKALLINKACPTPLVMFYVLHHDLPYGMMITASHNPAIYNGIKVFTAGGRDADEETTRELERRIKENDEAGIVPAAMEYEDARGEGLIEEILPINEYIDSILSEINVDAIRNAGLSVVIDPMYGVSETAIKTILITARCEVETIHGQHDTLFGGKLPAPNENAMRYIAQYVTDYHHDIGIATDGDADRIGVVDDQGRYLSPNDIMMLLYYYLVKYKGKHGPVVRNLCTTHMLDRIAADYGEKCYEVPVGFKWVSSKMTETDALLGGESSGGMSVRGHVHGKDGIYAAALLVEMLAVTGRKISQIYEEILNEYGRIVMVEHNYRFRAAMKPEYTKIIMEDRKVPELPFEIDHISYMDGCKVYFANGGWVSVRFSGTEPLLRIFCEMPDKESAEKVCSVYSSFLGLDSAQSAE